MKPIFSNTFFTGIFLVLLGVMLYFPVLDNWYSDFAGDDNWMVYENRSVFNLHPENIKEYFTSFYRGQYSPVNTLAYGIIYYFFGINPAYFHAFSLIVHLANVLLVFFFIKRLLTLGVKDGLKKEDYRYPTIAFLTALLFLIHPLQVESVVWVSASKVLLYTFFLLLALSCYLKYIGTLKRGFYLLSLVLFVLSFGSKEQAVVFPLILVLVDWYLNRDLKSKSVVLEKLPFFLLSLGFSVISMTAQQTGFSYKLENEYYPLVDRVFLASYAFTEYLFKLAIPFKLSAWYKFPIAPGEAVPLKYYFYPVLILFLVYFLWKWRKAGRYWILFGVVFFVVNIMLTLHILPMARGVLMADRYVYMGSIGIFYTMSVFLVNTYDTNRQNPQRRLMLTAFVLYLVGLGGYTFWYIDHWNIM